MDLFAVDQTWNHEWEAARVEPVPVSSDLFNRPPAVLEMIRALEANALRRYDGRGRVVQPNQEYDLMLKSTLASVCVDNVATPRWWIQCGAVYTESNLLLKFSNDRLGRCFARFDTPAWQFPRLPERGVSKVPGMKQQQTTSSVQNSGSHCVALDYRIRHRLALSAMHANVPD